MLGCNYKVVEIFEGGQSMCVILCVNNSDLLNPSSSQGLYVLTRVKCNFVKTKM